MDVLADLWRTDRRRVLLAVLCITLEAASLAVAATLSGPVLVDRSWSAFGWFTLAALIVVVCALSQRLVLADLSSRWAQALRARLVVSALAQDLPALEVTPVGELLDRIDDDTHQSAAGIRDAGRQLLLGLVSAVFATIAAGVLWWPAAVANMLVGSLFLAVLEPLNRPIVPARTAQEEAWSDLATILEEGVYGQDDIRSSLARPHVLGLYAARAREVLTRGALAWKLSARVSFTASMMVRVLAAVVVVGAAFLAARSQLSLTRLASLWPLMLLFGSNVEFLTRMFPQVQESLGSWARVQLLLDAPAEAATGSIPAPGPVRIEALTFTYGGPPALDRVSLTLQPGVSYALVGRSGSGKSTLAKVLTRAVSPPRGTVMFDSVDVLDLDVAALRRHVCTVTQRTEVFAGTLRDNVTLFDPALDPLVEPALVELDLLDWAASLPDGLDTMLGEDGVHLSAGEEQLVAFARVLVRDPRVVILDEATARMDPVTEARVERATRALVSGRISVLIAHRLSSVEHCDQVVVLEAGRILEAGPLLGSSRFKDLVADAERRDLPPVALSHTRPMVDAPAVPSVRPAPTLVTLAKMVFNDPRFGLTAASCFLVSTVLGLDGAGASFLWAKVLAEPGSLWPGVLAGVLLVGPPIQLYALRVYPRWWVLQTLRIRTRVLFGQLAPRRSSRYAPGEVVALTNGADRAVGLANHIIDVSISLGVLVSVLAFTRSWLAIAVFVSALGACALSAHFSRHALARLADTAVSTRNRFARTLSSALTGARTLKLAASTAAAAKHLAALDSVRSEASRREARARVWATIAPVVVSTLLPVLAWSTYLTGHLSLPAVLVLVAALGLVRWFGWSVASLVSGLPAARLWLARATSMAGHPNLTDMVPGVDFPAGTAGPPGPVERDRLEVFELRGFGAVHEDGTLAAHGMDLRVSRGQLVLLTGLVGAGKSSALKAIAGIIHHQGDILWNGQLVTSPELFLRPGRVSYVAQLPRVVSGTLAANVLVGHPFGLHGALDDAQLASTVDLLGGTSALIGHKGTRLSGGQLQRLAVARALAPVPELLVADDVSSALDVGTELLLWGALKDRGLTVVGSTFKRSALALADLVVVLDEGAQVAVGTWEELEPTWGHLAG